VVTLGRPPHRARGGHALLISDMSDPDDRDADLPGLDTDYGYPPSMLWLKMRSAMRQVLVLMYRHLVDLIAAIALIIVLSHATFTTSNEAIARYSGVLSDLSLAILAAWIFNLLIVVLPRRQDRLRLYSGVAWMVGLMAHSGHEMMEFLSHPVNVNINIDPQIGGVIIPASRDVTNRICAAVGPMTPYVPLPGAIGCWELIRNQIDKAREYHCKLLPWLPAFDVEVSAAMNDVILSQLSMTCEMLPRIGNSTLEELSEQIYEHWKACDRLMEVHYAKVQPYVQEWVRSLPRRERRNFTPARHNALTIANARKANAERNAAGATSAVEPKS
jgi:hypothetical protein